MKPRLIVLTGAGVSAESGLKTFRDSGGLWEGYDIMKVATPEGWAKNPALVLEFYNLRRKNVVDALPNEAHKALAALEEKYDVTVITQNIDDLHERAGSTNVIHLHGEILKAKSSRDDALVYEWKTDLHIGDKCERGYQLRPHVVWFGEAVPMIETAAEITSTADLFLVVGTSLVVYPAAGLINYAPSHIPKYLVDPHVPAMHAVPQLELIQEKASVGVPLLVQRLLQ